MGPNGILCTRWEKEYASVRQTFVACDDCLVKNEAYDAEEKAHTSKRVSVIACDNVISKVQLSGTPRDTCTRGEKAQTSIRVSIIARDNAISTAQFAPWGKTLPPRLRW